MGDRFELHRGTVRVEAVDRPVKRTRAGRPRKDEPRETERVFTLSADIEVDPAAIAAMRRRAACFVLILALMVRNSMQATIRSELASRGETLMHPFTKKPEKSLTPEMAFEHFAGLLGQVVTLGEHSRRMPVRLSLPAAKILELFRFDDRIFGVPEARGLKWVDRPAGTPGM